MSDTQQVTAHPLSGIPGDVELLDVLTVDGQPTGRTAPKDLVHREGLWHRTAHVWIVNSNGSLLLQRRGPQMETHPNHWDISSAGHLSAGESARQGARRELGEELGFEVDPDALEHLGTVRSEGVHRGGSYINREYQEVYLIVRDVRPEMMTLQASEVSQLALVPWREVERRVTDRDPELVPHDEEYGMLFSTLRTRFP